MTRCIDARLRRAAPPPRFPAPLHETLRDPRLWLTAIALVLFFMD